MFEYMHNNICGVLLLIGVKEQLNKRQKKKSLIGDDVDSGVLREIKTFLCVSFKGKTNIVSNI